MRCCSVIKRAICQRSSATSTATASDTTSHAGRVGHPPASLASISSSPAATRLLLTQSRRLGYRSAQRGAVGARLPCGRQTSSLAREHPRLVAFKAAVSCSPITSIETVCK